MSLELLPNNLESGSEGDDELELQRAPSVQLFSSKKGSATSGLMRAPTPMKKCKACGEKRRRSGDDVNLFCNVPEKLFTFAKIQESMNNKLGR